jgi:dihydrolipoamide dehydrogenase
MSFKDAGANVEVSVQMKDGTTKVFTGENALISIGRRTNTQALGLEKAGILNDRGRITVNDKMETNIPGIYAVGDCIGQIMLAHIASAQGEVAAENALGHNSVFDSKTNPSCVYTKPEFASVGLTEEAAKAQGVDYIVGKFPLAANGRAMIMGEDGMIKIIAGKKYKEILGAHILGPRATDLIGELALAIGMEATIDEVIATIHAHPTVAEAIKEATLAVEKRAIHIPNK